MTRRLIKRNAHACTTIAGGWLLFSLFAVWDWRDAHRYLGDPNAVFNYGIWGCQLLFLFFAVYFHRTETPREVLWFEDTKGYASGIFPVADVAAIFKQLTSHVPELTDSEIEKIVAVSQEAAVQGEKSITIPIMFRDRSEGLFVSFESWGNGVLEVRISAHRDLADEIDQVLAPYREAD